MATRVVAFYGYKGGTGRSMLAANVAATLALVGQKVLLVDWDLEAPGVGDFLDYENGISEKWRRSPGILELLGDCASCAPNALSRLFAEKLSLVEPGQSGLILRVELPGFKALQLGSCDPHQMNADEWSSLPGPELHLLGPGAQEGDTFADNLLTADWLRFYDAEGSRFCRAFRDGLARKNYDTVIIDTRTGLNLSTMFVLRMLADTVYFFSSKTHQALGGTVNVWEILHGIEADRDSFPERRLVLTRYRAPITETPDRKPETGSQEDDALEFISTIDGNGNGPGEPLYFPILSGFPNLESLILKEDNLLRNIVYLGHSHPNENFDRYRKSFYSLCGDVGAIDLGKVEPSTWKKQFPDPAVESFDKSRVEVRYRDFEWRKKCWDNYTEALKSEKPGYDMLNRQRRTDSKPPEDPVGSAKSTMLQWFRSANHIQRHSFRRYARGKLPKEVIGLIDTEVRDILWLDSDASRSSEKHERLPDGDVAGSAERDKPRRPGAPNVTTWQIEQAQNRERKRASELWRQARRLEDEDNPVEAARKFLLAEEQVGSALKFGDSDVVPGLRNDLAIYVMSTAQLHGALADWSKGIQAIKELLDAEKIEDTRNPVSTTEVSRIDLGRCALWLAFDQMRSRDKPLSPAERDFIQRIAGELPELTRKAVEEAGWDEKEADDDRVLADRIELLIAVYDGTEAKQLACRARALAHGRKNQLEINPTKGMDWARRLRSYEVAIESQAFAALWSKDKTDADDLYSLLHAAHGEILEFAPWTDVDSSISTQLSLLTTLFADCGLHLETYDIDQELVRLAGRGTDSSAITRRNEALAGVSLTESKLGRPDLSLATLKAAQKLLSDDVPEGSRRGRAKTNRQWWRHAMRTEIGDAKAAVRLKAEGESRSREARDPDSKPFRRFDAEEAVKTIRPWCVSAAFDTGQFEEVLKLADEPLRQLKQQLATKLDSQKTYAVVCRKHAEAAYALGDDALALAAVGQGLESLAGRAWDPALSANGDPGSVDAKTLQSLFTQSALASRRDELLVLREEILAFGDGPRDPSVLDRTVDRLIQREEAWRNDPRARDWFHTDLVRNACLFAVAAAIRLRTGERDGAAKLAVRVTGSWVARLENRIEGDDNDWFVNLAKMARPALAITEAVLALATGQAPSDKDKAWSRAEDLELRDRKRFRRIFAFLGEQLGVPPEALARLSDEPGKPEP